MTTVCCPENTAIARAKPSCPAREVMRFASDLSVRSILDHGCGRGRDVAWYQKQGWNAEGYDPPGLFDFSVRPTTRFDLVTSVFVLNVLDSPTARLEALCDAASFVKPSGALFVVTRSDTHIKQEAKSKGWQKHSDGWWSKPSRGMFQHGLSHGEILKLGRQAGLAQHPTAVTVRLSADSSWALLTPARHR